MSSSVKYTFQGMPKAALVSREFASLQPRVNSPWEDSQTSRSTFNRIGPILPLSRIVRFSIVDLDRRNGPFLTQQPHCLTSKGAMQAGCSIAFCIEDIGDLSIHERSLVQFTDSAF